MDGRDCLRIFVASLTKMTEDQTNCRTQGLATHQEPWDWTSDVPLCQKEVWMLLRSLQWGVTVLPWELVLSSGGFGYWDDATQFLSMGKLDNLDQQFEILVEELRVSTIMLDRVYYLTMGVEEKYEGVNIVIVQHNAFNSDVVEDMLRPLSLTRDSERKNKYEVEEFWGPGRGHPGNKILNITMVSTVGLGIKMAFKGWP